MKKQINILIILCLLAFSQISASEEFKVAPKPRNSHIYDGAHVLSQKTEYQLDQIIEELYQKTGFVLGIALYQDIGDAPYREFAMETAQTWGLGKKGQDEAALIFLAMKQKRRSIEVGYGAEGYIPDAMASRIQEEFMVPFFQKNDFSSGIANGALQIINLVAKEKGVEIVSMGNNRPVAAQKSNQGSGAKSIILLIIIVILAIVTRGRIFLLFLGANALGGGSSGFGGGGSSGGFGGGFGGGSFGGGGSGGSW